MVKAVQALAPLAAEHDLVITHGNGPQVGMLALESAHDPALSRPYPFDVLGAQTQGMIGYWLVQALQNALPGRQAACLVSRTLVRPTTRPSRTRPSSSARSTTSDRPAPWPRASTGRSARTAAGGAGSCPRPSRPSCSTCLPSRCCSTAGRSWSAPAAAAYPS